VRQARRMGLKLSEDTLGRVTRDGRATAKTLDIVAKVAEKLKSLK
jgi:hypothetical protein